MASGREEVWRRWQAAGLTAADAAGAMRAMAEAVHVFAEAFRQALPALMAALAVMQEAGLVEQPTTPDEAEGN